MYKRVIKIDIISKHIAIIDIKLTKELSKGKANSKLLIRE